MKTPREILLKKHQAAGPELDRIAHDVLRQIVPEPAAKPSRTSRWIDWLWPSPVAWGAVAAVWVIIIALNAASREPARAPSTLARRSPEMIQALREQREIFVELVAPAAREPEPVRPKRRSDYVQPTVRV